MKMTVVISKSDTKFDAESDVAALFIDSDNDLRYAIFTN